ncbi:MAG: TPM domain-containing protein [Microscillaceae bacterium]|jgi:uncharacterized membrane protein|nr:TPM domain-containing protein [Microscillaceae bacterium]
MKIPFLNRRFFSTAQEDAIIQTIKTAEKHTSGEIKVHVESQTHEDVFARALEVFRDLNMHHTIQRNGVLFYLATTQREFAIVADEGINRLVAENFWENIKDNMRAQFKTAHFVEGLSEAILATGKALQTHFPYQRDDKNELSDDISQG